MRMLPGVERLSSPGCPLVFYRPSGRYCFGAGAGAGAAIGFAMVGFFIFFLPVFFIASRRAAGS
jgi:hypothetical protein